MLIAMADSVVERLQRFRAGILEYQSALEGRDKLTSVKRRPQKLSEMRSRLAEQYGGLKTSIAEALGGIPSVQTGYRDFGDVFHIILADPEGNPMLDTALEGSLRSVEMAIGHFNGRELNEPAEPAEEYSMHPRIHAATSRLVQSGFEAQAIFEGAKALLQLLREKTGLTDDGLPLVERALTPKKPMLVFNDLRTEAEIDEHRGVFHLFQGVVLALRHPGAHSTVTTTTPRTAELLGLCSYLAYRLDGASPVSITRRQDEA